jgi:hypothetical protein
MEEGRVDTPASFEEDLYSHALRDPEDERAMGLRLLPRCPGETEKPTSTRNSPKNTEEYLK